MSWCTGDDSLCPEQHETGELCAECERLLELETAYWRREYQTATMAERDPKRYREEMIDAGRGHLLREDER